MICFRSRSADSSSGSCKLAGRSSRSSGGAIAAVTSDDPRLLKINDILDEEGATGADGRWGLSRSAGPSRITP